MMIRKALLACLIMSDLVLAGCSQDTYSIEREYYRVQHKAGSIMKNPDAAPPNEIKRVVDTLLTFTQKYPKTNVALDAEFTIVRLYTVKKFFHEARDQIEKIINKYSDSKVICAEAVFMRGLTYEAQDDWNSAIKEYQYNILTYPETARGLEAPLYIASHYKKKFQPDKMVDALNKAVAHYKELSHQSTGTQFGLQARLLVARCYMELKDWNKAIDVLNGVIEDYKDKVRPDAMLLDIANIYYTQLKDPAKAKEFLAGVIKDYPKSPNSSLAKKFMEVIENGKK